MSKRVISTAAAVLTGLGLGLADELQLKDGAAITGRVLAEKPDQIAVDVGYTVLVVPRSHIAKIIKSDSTKAEKPTKKSAPATAVSIPADTKQGIFATASPSISERSVRDLVAQIGEAVVQVRTPGGLGSGFFINEDGFLITNFHVIEGESQISIEVYHQKAGQLDRRSYKQVRIVAVNKFGDLALLKIEDRDAPKFVRVLLGDADALAVGERVFAVGSPQGLERTVTEGIVSTKSRPIEGALFLQTSAQINPGNSGGPLFNLRGEVVGVTNMKRLFAEGLGFAIPVDAVKFFLNHRDAFAYDNDNPNNAFRYLEPPSRIRETRSEAKPQ
jgi:serine protease Do